MQCIVEPAERGDHSVNQRLAIAVDRNVRLEERCGAPCLLDKLHGLLALDLPDTATRAPAPPKATAVARPIPEVPPVTNAVLPAKS